MPEQSYANHVRRDPVFLTLGIIFLINVIVAITVAVRHFQRNPGLRLWAIVLAVALLVLAGLVRSYAVRTQDRIIRLEERLRLAALLAPDELLFTQALTTPQLIALRFASDAELHTLARRAVAESLTPAQIKQAIQTWRPDHHRV